MSDREPNDQDDALDATEDVEAAAESADLDFLPERHGTRWTEETVRSRLMNVREVIADMEADAGARTHRLGTRLRELYAHFAELALGYPTFAALSRAEFGLTRTETYDALKIALHATEEQARGYGVSRSLKGLRLIALTGVEGFDALREVPLKLEDGSVVHFPATRRELESAIRVLVAKERTAQARRLPRALAGELQRLNRGLAEQQARDPALAGVKATFVAVDGEPRLRLGRVGRAQWVALAKALLRLEREG